MEIKFVMMHIGTDLICLHVLIHEIHEKQSYDFHRPMSWGYDEKAIKRGSHKTPE